MYDTRESSRSVTPEYDFWARSCGDPFVKEGSYSPKIFEYDYVYSYRGPKDKTQFHPFVRERFRIDKTVYFEGCVGNYSAATWDIIPSWTSMPGRTKGDAIDYNVANYLDDELIEWHRDVVVTGVFAKVNAPEIDLAPMFFELADTLTSIYDALKAMFSILKLAESVKDFVKNPEKAWLTWRYAILPMILDITSIIDAFKGGSARRLVQEYDVYDSKMRKRVSIDPYYKRLYFDYNESIQLRTGATLVVLSQVDPAPLGTSLFDVGRGLWEVIPFSFIFDWFIDVGTWLASVRETNLVIEKSYVTTVLERDIDLWFSHDQPEGWIMNGGPTEGKPLKVRGHKIVRETSISPPTMPTLNVQVSITRTVDAVSLIIGLLKSILRR